MKIEYIGYALLAIATGFILLQIIRKGFKGALFHGRIVKTYGVLNTLPVSGWTNKIKVHEIQGKTENTIGIEVTGPFDVIPIRLGKADVPQLIEILKKTQERSQQEIKQTCS